MTDPRIQDAADSTVIPDEGAVLTWTVHPMKRRPLVAVAVTLFIMLIGAIVFYSTESRLFAVLALVILFASVAKYYFPTSYRLTDRKITVKSTTQTLHKEWSLYRSCWPDKNGILLSPFAEQSRLENFRGIYLLFNDNKEAVTAFVKARLNRDFETPSSGDKA